MQGKAKLIVRGTILGDPRKPENQWVVQYAEHRKNESVYWVNSWPRRRNEATICFLQACVSGLTVVGHESDSGPLEAA